MWNFANMLKICSIIGGFVGAVTAATLSDFNSSVIAEASTMPTFVRKISKEPQISTKCDSIEGKWYNELGSEMIVMEDNGVLIGEYRTAVERTPGAAGKGFSIMRGVETPFDSGNAVGFSVVWNGGKSLTSWIGECSKCEGKEVLRTTWMLRVKQDSLGDQWKSTLVNEDVFVRSDKLEGPRKHLGTDVPKRPVETGNETLTRVAREAENNDSRELTEPENDFTGKWYSKDGVELELFTDNNVGTIEGLFVKGKGVPYSISGSFAPGKPNGTLGLYATIEDFESALVGVGQYYMDSGNEVLETSWLQRKIGESAEKEISPVSFIRKTFKRTPQPSC